MPIKSRIYTQPTYTVNQVKGWKTRLLYSYWSSADNETGGNISTGRINYSTAAATYEDDIFKIIGDVTTTKLTNELSYMVKGGKRDDSDNNLYFPPDYWKTGKSIRIKGGLFLPGASNNDIFNMRLRFRDDDGTTDYTIASQNNGNNHTMTFKTESYDENGPYVNYEYVYTSVVGSEETSGNEDFGNTLYIKAEGYYQYDNNNINYYNDEVRFVPVYNATPYATVYSGQPSTNTRVMIDFYNSNVSTILLSYVTVEELQ